MPECSDTPSGFSGESIAYCAQHLDEPNAPQLIITVFRTVQYILCRTAGDLYTTTELDEHFFTLIQHTIKPHVKNLKDMQPLQKRHSGLILIQHVTSNSAALCSPNKLWHWGSTCKVVLPGCSLIVSLIGNWLRNIQYRADKVIELPSGLLKTSYFCAALTPPTDVYFISIKIGDRILWESIEKLSRHHKSHNRVNLLSILHTTEARCKFNVKES